MDDWEPNALLKRELLKQIHINPSIELSRKHMLMVFETFEDFEKWCTDSLVGMNVTTKGYNLRKE